MAKKDTVIMRLVSTADTGSFYTIKRQTKQKDIKKRGVKLELRKYDKKIRKHVLFVEKKQK